MAHILSGQLPYRSAHRGGRYAKWQRTAVVAAFLVAASCSQGRPARAVLVATGSEAADSRGRMWRSIRGDWRLMERSTLVDKPGAGATSLIVSHAASPAVTVKARLSTAASGAGIVFRYKDPFDYWSLTAVRNVATWQLRKIVGGRQTFATSTGFTPTRNGTVVTVTTKTDGTIYVSFNGTPPQVLTDNALADQTGVGLIALGASAQHAVFEDFQTLAVLPAP